MTNDEAIKCFEMDRDLLVFDSFTGETIEPWQLKVHNKDSYYDYLADSAVIMMLQRENYNTDGCNTNSERVVEFPCAVGDTVFVEADCHNVFYNMDFDTGQVVCPFVDDCDADDCEKEGDKKRILRTTIKTIYNEGHGWEYTLNGLNLLLTTSDFGRTIFSTREALELSIDMREKMTVKNTISNLESRMKEILSDATSGEKISLEQIKQRNKCNYDLYCACETAVAELRKLNN